MKKIGLSWKKIRNKFSLLSFIIVPVVGVVSLGSYNNLGIQTNNLNPISSSLSAIDSSTSSVANYSMTASEDAVSWWGTKTPNQVTNDDIKGLITVTPTQGSTVTINVTVLPITQSNIVKGYVNFIVTEVSVDSSGNVTNSYATPPSGKQTTDTNFSELGISVPNNKIWSTQSFSGLIQASKYNYAWVSDTDIANYLKNFKGTTLTQNDVWLNMLDHSNNNMPPLKDDSIGNNEPSTMITVNNIDSSYGIWSINVKSNNTQSDEFVNSTNMQLDRTVRGVAPTNSSGAQMVLESSSNIGTKSISDPSLFDGATSNSNVSTLTASQFVSPTGGNSALINMFTKGTGIGDEPIVDLAYAGKKYKIDGSGETTNGVTITDDSSATTIEANKLTVSAINTIPNDNNGSLQVILTYTTLDVYSNSYISTSSTLSWPAGTFKTNPNANKDFTFSWKNQNDISQLGTSYDIVNSFKKNQANTIFTKVFSNQFFNGTSDSYVQDRDVSIDYVGGSTVDAGGNYISSSSNSQITITLTFKGLSGFTYTENGQSMEGLRTSATFQLNAYQINSGLTIAWNTNANLFTANPTFNELTPSDVSQRVMAGTLQDSAFYTLATQSGTVQASYYPDNKNGALTVYVSQVVTSGNSVTRNLYTQIYTGFKATDSDNQIVEYSWLPQDQVSESLLTIPLDQVTKSDVINLYLKNIGLFENLTLNDSNVTIIPVTNSGINYLNIQVYLPMWNQSTTGITKGDQVFYTNLYGFSQTQEVNSTKFNPPKDYTALISVTASSIICVSLASVLIAFISRRARIRKFKEKKVKKDTKVKKV
ncbi:MAG: hypothetical protein K2I67_02330 [Malacoplasma sp.]|nr:hypothetical protein [Malacoplasma sp.]